MPREIRDALVERLTKFIMSVPYSVGYVSDAAHALLTVAAALSYSVIEDRRPDLNEEQITKLCEGLYGEMAKSLDSFVLLHTNLPTTDGTDSAESN